MKKLLTFWMVMVFVLTLPTIQVFAQAGVTTPRTPSPAASVKQTIGISTVSIDYSRPKVNNRPVWGTLVPYGWNVQAFGAGNSAPWRAGANENSVITLSHPAKIEGQVVPAGSYGLFFVINQDNSGEVVLSKDFRSWGSFFYDQKQDQLRAKIQVRDVSSHAELLTYDFANLTKNSGELVLNWEKKQFPVKIEFAVDEIVMANADAELKGQKGFTPQGFVSAANYALQNDVNKEQALRWIDQAIATNRNFPSLNIKSQLLRKTGKTAEADKLLAEGMTIATEVELNAYGYQLLGLNQHDKAIEVLALVTQRFPKSANAWDSLGEAYATKGDKDNAIKNFKKSLSLNPPENVRVNSEKFLKQYGAL
jgi:TolA-binding protein